MSLNAEPTSWSTQPPSLRKADVGGAVTAFPSGDWTLAHASVLEKLVSAEVRALADGTRKASAAAFAIDFSAIGQLDTVGALLLNRLVLASQQPLKMMQGEDKHRVLMQAVNANDLKPNVQAKPKSGPLDFFVSLGRMGKTFVHELAQVLSILGGASAALVRWLTFVRRFRWAAYLTHLERTGLNAAPIVALMSFLIGGILAQQGTFYFRRFGADLYVVDLAGMLTLRELGVLLTAIMVAGRSGSALTAELGSMKMREEIDALRVLGIDPVEVLILPRLLALITALPILTLIADLAALFGAALDAAIYGGIPGEVFLSRLHEAIDLQEFFVGFTKAPFMALIIGLIASLEGLNVLGSTESLGEHTTQAVVKSIFFVIVVDGFFAVFFASIGI